MCAKKILTIVGLGIQPHLDATLESINAIKDADVCITADPTEVLTEFVNVYNQRINDVSNLYVNHKDRRRNYDAIVRSVLNAVDKHQNITYVTYGSPSVLDHPCSLLIAEGKKRGFDCTILPGISFIEKYLALSGTNIGTNGLNVVLAKKIVQEDWVLNTSQPLIIAQIIELGQLNDDLKLAVTPEQLGELATKLRDYYSVKQFVSLFSIAPTASKPSMEPIPLTALPLLSRRVGPLTSAYIPAIEKK